MIRAYPTSIVIAILLAELLSACNDRNEKIIYYPSGEIMERAPLGADGIYEGEVKDFYKKGQIKFVMPFHNHRINGLVKRYYNNGQLESSEFYKDGKTFGERKQYYATGRLKYTTKIIDGAHVDTAHYYHSNGELAQMIVYDSTGRKIDFAAWNKGGILDPSYTTAIFLSNKDSISFGENYSFELRLGNRHSGSIIIKILSPKSGIDSAKGKYANTRYIIRKPLIGPHVLKARLYEHWSHEGSDTIWVDTYDVKHEFRVLKRGKLHL